MQFSVTQHHINAPSGVISLSQSIPRKKIKKTPPGKERKKKIKLNWPLTPFLHIHYTSPIQRVFIVWFNIRNGGAGEGAGGGQR